MTPLQMLSSTSPVKPVRLVVVSGAEARTAAARMRVELAGHPPLDRGLQPGRSSPTWCRSSPGDRLFGRSGVCAGRPRSASAPDAFVDKAPSKSSQVGLEMV